MKLTMSYVSAVISIGVGVTQAADLVPKRPDFSRYQAMMERSPFAVATAAALPASTPNFAKDLYIANAARSPDGDMVTVANANDKNFKEYLTTKQPNDHGYAIANIEWSERVGQTKVTISKDGQFATVAFNQALLAVTPGMPGGAPGYQQPPQPLPQPQVNPPNSFYPPGATAPPVGIGKPAVPGVATPPPRTRGVIPRNPSAVNTPPIPGVVATPVPVPPQPVPQTQNSGDDE